MAFLDWCMESRPAERYALVIGSHGSGPKADDVYANVRAAVDRTSTTAEPPRAIAFDDGSRSFLSIPDLRRALDHGVEKAGKPFAVVLFDACYMASVEVLQEMQQLADYVVASPEAVPGPGMPYTALLQVWQAWVGWKESNAKLATFAVDAFQGAYEDTAETASLLAVDMAQVPRLTSALNVLGATLLLGEKARPLVADAIAGVKRTSDPDFAYLDGLCSDLITTPGTPKAIAVAADDVREALSDMMEYSWEGGTAWGPTIFLPRGPVPAWYKDLAIAKTPWGEWVTLFS
jgi:hypothetical protein